MFETIFPSHIQASGLNDSFSHNGIDLLASIQILLVQDYDNQLRHVGKMMKGGTAIKAEYRKVMEFLQNMMTRKTEKIKDKDDKEQDAIYVTKEEYALWKDNFENISEFSWDLGSNKLLPYNSPAPKEEGNLIVNTKRTANRNIDGYYLNKSVLSARLENYKLKLESVNEQSELNSLGLQSLTNQRKIALETVSNLVSKQSEGVSTIIRNMRS